MTYSMSPEEMKQLSTDLSQLFSAFSTVKTPAHPGVGVHGQPELSDAYEAFSQAAQTRVGESGNGVTGHLRPLRLQGSKVKRRTDNGFGISDMTQNANTNLGRDRHAALFSSYR